MIDPIHLPALIASRICHDLISPIGAISNGVELMMMDASGTSSQEMALIIESAAHANARIRYFRVAFGQSAPDQRISRSEAVAILNDGALGGRLKVQWDSPNDLARRDVKLVFLGLLCMETALIQGGEVTVSLGDAGWHLAARAPRIRRDAALWDGLANAGEDAFHDIAAGQVHFALLALEAARQHRALQLAGGEAEGTLEIRF